MSSSVLLVKSGSKRRRQRPRATVVQSLVAPAPRGRRRRRRQRKRRSAVANVNNVNYRYIKCLLDPFENAPVYPGFEGIHGDLFTVKTKFPFTCNGDGSTYVVINPGMVGHITENTATFNSTPTYTYTNSVGKTTVSANYYKGRPIAMGVRMYCTQNASSNQGQVSYGLMPGGSINLDTPSALNTTNLVNNSEHLRTGNFRDGCQVIWLPEDPNDFVHNTGFVTGSAVTAGAPWAQSPEIVIVLNACAASAGAYIEVIQHFECHYALSTGLESGLDSTRRDNTTTADPLSLIDQVLGTLSSGFKLVASLAGPLGSSNFTDAVSAAAEWYTGPSLGNQGKAGMHRVRPTISSFEARMNSVD